MTNAEIIDHHDLIFDPGDPLNGSLYVCLELGVKHDAERDAHVAMLRELGLWSNSALKQVPDEQRDAYKSQMTFVEAATYQTAAHNVTIARFDHPKFPSSAARFDAWKSAFDGTYTRL
jgi:hypothetical protein